MTARRKRRRGEGSVWQAEDGRWTAQVGYRGPDGKRKYLTRTLPNERAAKEAVRGLQAKVGVDRELLDTSQPLDRFLAEWLARKTGSVRASTLRAYESHVRLHISPLLGGMPVGDVRVVDVERLVRDRSKAGQSPASIQRILTTLSMALEEAVVDGRLARNVARSAKRPRVERRPIEALTPARATAILQAVHGDRDEALYVLLLGSGMRVGEALGLSWRDVDLDGGTAFIRAGKTARSVRTLPLPSFVVDALRAHRARAATIDPQAPVFTGERKHLRQRVDVITHRFPMVLEAAKLPRMRVHDLRHGHATLLLAAGVPIRVIADQLGHATPSITMNVYAHAQPDSLRAAVGALDELIRH